VSQTTSKVFKSNIKGSFFLTFSSWECKEGPKKDRYNISDNPQYRLELKSSQPSAVWCLLSRHITDKVCVEKSDFCRNSLFVAFFS